MNTLNRKRIITKDEKIIDASGQVLGRLASRIAYELAGKNNPNFNPSVFAPFPLKVIHASQIRITGEKLTQKRYKRYSGYPSGLKEKTLQEKMKQNSAFVIRNAVRGMLAKNKSRKHIIKYLTVED